MKNSGGAFILGIIVFFLVFTIALALENVLENNVIINEMNPYITRILNNKIAFFNDGYVNYVNYSESILGSDGEDRGNMISHNKLMHYDMNGNLVKEVDVPYFDLWGISSNGFDDLIVTDEFIYVFGVEHYESKSVLESYEEKIHNIYIYKYDKNLDVVLNIKVSDFDAYFDASYYVDSEGFVYIYLTYMMNDVPVIIKVDKDFNYYEEIDNTSENVEKYFPSKMLEKSLNVSNDYNLYFAEEFSDMTDIDNYVIGFRERISTPEEDRYIAYLKYVVDGEISFEIKNEDYTKFSSPKVFNNLIFVFGCYNDTMIGYKNDILIYDLAGNLLQVIENNSINQSYDIKDDKLILARNYFDGALYCSYYNFFKRHEVYFYNDIYKINDDFLGSSVTDNPKEEKPIYDIKNPETKDIAIILILLLSVVSFIYFIITNKKKRFVDN